MREGKLTLPAIYAVNNTSKEEVKLWAQKVKEGTASASEIQSLVEYSKVSGGIAYAEKRMAELHDEALKLLSDWKNATVREALHHYIDYVMERKL